MTNAKGLTPISEILPGVVKEITRRAELRPRLEAERCRPVDDEAFLTIAKLDGIEL